MKTISKYIRNLEFEYAISYSGLRGEKFTKLEKRNKIEIQRIEEEIKSARFIQMPKLKEQIEILEREINIINSRIIKKCGEFHKSSESIRKFQKEDEGLKEIFRILGAKFEEQAFAMCPPIFRDSIVFYSKEDEINGILQICFECIRMKTENEEDLKVGYKIFDTLKDKLIQIGHQIEHE